MKKLFFIAVFLILSSCNYAYAQTSEHPTNVAPPQEQTVCLSQTEANAVYVLAEKGKKFDGYAAKAESDISDLKASITTLKIELAKAVQQNIDLSNQATRDNAVLEQYRQYFFTHPQPKCKFSIFCLP